MASPFIHWEDRLVRFSLGLLTAGVAYGILAGAGVTIFYERVPNMGVLEDRLSALLSMVYGLAILLSLPHLPRALADWAGKRREPAIARTLVTFGPLVVVLGAEGLISHYLFWAPFSSTDRFHLLHHSLVAALPLTAGYAALVRARWRPEFLAGQPSVSPRILLASASAILVLLLLGGLLMGIAPAPVLLGGIAVGGLGFVAAALLGR